MNGEVIQDASVPEGVVSLKKKYLFNRPKWSKLAEQKEKDEVAFFSRAKELFPLRISEEERKKEKKQARAERKRTTESAERKRTTESEERRTPDAKRRRISAQEEWPADDCDDDDDNHEEASGTRGALRSTASRISQGRSSTQTRGHTTTNSLSDCYSRDLKNKGETSKQSASCAVITLSDSEADDLYSASPVKKSMNHAIDLLDIDGPFANETIIAIQDEDNDLVADDEYSELVEKARQKRAELERQNALERQRAESSFAEKNHGTELDDVFGEDRMEVDPILSILVTSYLGGSKPLVLLRRVSQRLKEVKEAWTDRQGPGVITEEMRPDIVLTWRGKQLFDVTTCAHLGIKMGPDGKLPPERLDDFGRLHLEAWTNEFLSSYTQQHEQAKLASKDHENQGPKPEPESKVEVEKIKLILKARDMDPIKMRTPVTYLVRKVEEHFRIKHPEIGDKEIILYFEGERLHPEMLLKDTDLGDMGEADTIEVLIK